MVQTIRKVFNVSLEEFEERFIKVDTKKDRRHCVETMACFGDTLLGLLVVQSIWSKNLADVARMSKGKASVDKAVCVSNKTLAAYIHATLARSELRKCEQYFNIELHEMSSASEHRCGTVFEALLWGAHEIHGREAAVVVVRGLCEWVSTTLSPSFVKKLQDIGAACEDFDSADTSLSHVVQSITEAIDAISSQDMFPVLQVSAPLEWARFPTASPTGSATSSSSESVTWRTALLASHNFDLGDIGPRNCNIANRATTNNWQGTFCRECHAMLVVRSVSNKRSEFFVIGMQNCPSNGSLADWLPTYHQLLSQDVCDVIDLSILQEWLFYGQDMGDIECSRCLAVYEYIRCSNKHKCKGRGCSNRNPCHLERQSPCTCRVNGIREIHGM